MAREKQSLFSLNRGIVSRLGLARADVRRIALAAETQTNWMIRVLGAMTMRPGFGYLGATLSNSAARMLKFVFSTTDTALLELTDSYMRIWISDVLLTRPSVTTTIANGTFPSDLSNWTDLDDGGATSSWVAPNYMQLVGNGTARAMREQMVSPATTNLEHGIRIVVARGPVKVRIGSTSGDDDYLRESTLYTGTHSISITPTGNFYIRFFSTLTQKVFVSNCTIESAGVVSLPTPWTASDLNDVRTDQSGDVVFVACAGYQQRRIERRGTGRSWSVVLYAPDDGPFGVQNLTNITLTPSALNGNITVTASLPLFKSPHVGALFSISSVGQSVTTSSASSGTPTNSIRVAGITDSRAFTIIISGNASASTVNLQRSYDNTTWANVSGKTWTANTTETYTDGLDNQIAYYRLILTTRVAPDSVTMQLQFGSGSVRGVVRITDYTSSTSVGAEVVVDLGGTTATSVWQEGKWSDLRGWPTSVKIHDGRMWWAGQNGIVGSISDAYDSFDEDFVGDAGPINRTIGSGPVDVINWILSLKGLMVGAQGAEYSVRASSLDEILTPTNFNMKGCSTQGSGGVDAIKVDQTGYYINRSGMKLFTVEFNVQSYDYSSDDAMLLVPEIGYPGIVRMDVQRTPETRIHCVNSDGTVAVLVMNKLEQVSAWLKVETDGLIEDVVVLPASTGNLDDQVYYVVKRTINGSTVRYLEKWAQEIDCRGDQDHCFLADSYVLYSGVKTDVITGLGHLEGEEVVVWADGLDVGTDDSVTPWVQRYTVSGGQITLADAAATVVVGLGYEARFKSAKLGTAEPGKSSLNQPKRVDHLGVILADSYRKVPQYGPDFTYMDDMPLIESGAEVPDGTTTNYDENMIEFPGNWTTDARVCLRGVAPRPCTVLAITMDEVKI
jgi:hypothetical protein